MNRFMKIEVNNIPTYKLREYTVIRIVESEAWFYGTYDNYDEARNVALEIDGIVVEECKG